MTWGEGSREGWRVERGRKKGGLKEKENETKLQGLFESLICRQRAHDCGRVTSSPCNSSFLPCKMGTITSPGGCEDWRTCTWRPGMVRAPGGCSGNGSLHLSSPPPRILCQRGRLLDPTPGPLRIASCWPGSCSLPE